MSVTTTLAACSQTVSANGPDGTVDAPSTLDDAIRYALSFVAQLRDTKAAIGANADITALSALASINGGQLAGTRSRIINGDMRIDQRNNGASASTGLGVLTYSIDRWIVAANGVSGFFQQGGTVGARTLNITGAAGNTGVSYRQRIESQNIADLAGKAVTLSFQVSSTTLTSLPLQVGYATAQDNFTTVTSSFTATPTITGTLSTYSYTFTLPANAANGVELLFGPTAALTGSIVLANVQLEPGAVATPLERRSYGLELALCQRYYEPAVPVFARGMLPVNLAFIETPGYFKVSKRAMPTLIAAGAITASNVTSETAGNISTEGFRYTIQITNSNTDSYVIGRVYSASAEL